MSVPLYIPTFNNPTYTFNFINQVAGLNFSKIIIMDNNSTYPPMITLLNELESKYEVIRLDENLGPHLILRNPEYYKSHTDIFA
jgi:GT2 family glycosyltransferase